MQSYLEDEATTLAARRDELVRAVNDAAETAWDRLGIETHVPAIAHGSEVSILRFSVNVPDACKYKLAAVLRVMAAELEAA